MSNNTLENQMKQIIRRCDSIEKKQDLADQDRKLLEDISIQLSSIDNRLKIVEDNIRNSRKDLKEDIANVGEQVVGAVDNLTSEIDSTPTKKVTFFGKIRLIFKKKGGK